MKVTTLCKIVEVSRSAYYAWLKRAGKVVSYEAFRLMSMMRSLFKASRESLGFRQLRKRLQKEGFTIGRYRTAKLMKKLGLDVNNVDNIR